MLSTLLRGSVSRSVDALRPSRDASAIMAVESARVVLVDYDDEPREVCETADGFVVLGSTHGVSMVDGGLGVEALDEIDPVFHKRGQDRSQARLGKVQLKPTSTSSAPPEYLSAKNPQTKGKKGDEFAVHYGGKSIGTIRFDGSVWSSVDAAGKSVTAREGWSLRNSLVQLLGRALGDAWGHTPESVEVSVEVFEAKTPGKLIPIDDPVYTDRIKLPKYNVATNPLSAHGSDTGKLLASRLPGWTKDDHEKAADAHEKEAERLTKEWGDTAEKAAKATWGRSYQATDYRISGIASDEFADKFKDALRAAASGSSRHKDAAFAHRAAAKLRRTMRGESVQEAFASGGQLQALFTAAQKGKDTKALAAELTRKGYASEVRIVLRVAAEDGTWDDVLDALVSESVEEATVLPARNKQYGFYGTVLSQPSTKLADGAWEEAFAMVQKAFPKMKPETVRAVLDAKVGRWMAEYWIGGELARRFDSVKKSIASSAKDYEKDPDAWYSEIESVQESPCSPSPEFPIYTQFSFDLTDLILMPESGKSQLPYDMIEGIRRYVDMSPVVIRERRELARRVRIALEKDERFQKLLTDNGLQMKSRYDEAVDEGTDQYGSLTAEVNIGEMVTSGKARTATPRIQLDKFVRALDTAVGPDAILGTAVSDFFKTTEGRALLAKYGYSLVEGRLSATSQPQPTHGSPMKTKETADLVLGDGVVELRRADGNHTYVQVACDEDDPASVASAIEEVTAAAIEEGFAEVDESEGEALDGEVFDQFEAEFVEDLAADLADLAADGDADLVLPEIRLFDEAVAETDYEAAVARAEAIVKSLGEAALTEFKRRRGRALSTFRRSLKIQTPAEKMRNRKARRAYKTNPALRRKAKMYRRKFKRFLRNSTGVASNLGEGRNPDAAGPTTKAEARAMKAKGYKFAVWSTDEDVTFHKTRAEAESETEENPGDEDARTWTGIDELIGVLEDVRIDPGDVEVIEINHQLPAHMRENYASAAHQKSFGGKAATDDALLHAAMGFFGGTQGQTHTFAGLSASMEAAGYTGVKGSTDTQMMSILGRLVNEGKLRYVQGKGFTAVVEAFTAKALAEQDEPEAGGGGEPGRVVIRRATDVEGTQGREVVVIWPGNAEATLKGSTGSTRNFVSDDEVNADAKIDALVATARQIAAGVAPS